MTTEPSGKAGLPTHGDHGSSGSPAAGAQSQASLPAGVPAAGAAASEARQDVDQASTEAAASRPESASGAEGRLEDEASAGHGQQPKAATGRLAFLVPDSPKLSVSLQSPVWDGPAQDWQATQSPRVSQSEPLGEKATPRASVPGREEDLGPPPTPSAQVWSPQNVPAVSTADTDSQPDAPAAGTVTAAEKPEGPAALSPDTEAPPSAEPQAVTEGHSVDRSGVPQALPLPPGPGGSAPTLPGAPTEALEWRPLDSSLYGAVEENPYMRSVTSLLAVGEVSVGLLTDVLVWSETTMDVATGALVTERSSATNVPCGQGPRLHLDSSLLQGASAAFSWLLAGTGLVLRSVTHLLERVEQRTAEGICSAMRYLTSHLSGYHSDLYL
ncbi:testis expressed 44 [Phyllostomus discolor]|uniref:Testis expressed 44 n=1 Tax=Phyllostomus discolor TaxID=89673 RepID=A0A834EH10_9CHIR|nr:testis expressed 44 [Phyllostomus discolor]